MAGIKSSITSFADFDSQMRKVLTNLDATSFGSKGLEKGFKDLTAQVLEAGKKTPQSLNQITSGLFDIVSAGIDANRAMVALNAGLKLATAGGADSKTAIDALTSTINAYSLSLGDIDKVSAQFFEAQKFGKLDVQELAGAIADVAPIASNVGLSIEEMLASISAITLTGANASEAATQLRSILVALLKPTAEQAEEAKALGIEFGVQALKTKGLTGILKDLRTATNLSDDSFGKLFGRQEAISGILALTGSQFKQYENILKNISNETQSASNFTKAFDTQNESLSNQMLILANNITVVATNIGRRLSPVVMDINKLLVLFADSTNSAVNATSSLTDSLLAMGTAGVIAVGSLRTLSLLLGVTISGSTLLWAGAIAAATVGLYELGKGTDFSAKSAEKLNQSLQTSRVGIDFDEYNTQLALAALNMEVLAKKNDEFFKGTSPVPFPIDVEKQKKDSQESVSLLDKTLAQENQAYAEAVAKNADGISLIVAKEEEALQIKKGLTAEEKEQVVLLEQFKLAKKMESLQAQADAEILSNDLRFELGRISEEQYQINLQFIREEYALKKITAAKSEAKTLKQIDAELSRDKIAAANAENKKIEQDTLNSNATKAKMNAFFRTSEAKQSLDILDNLSTLTASKDRRLFELGKAASYARAIVNVALGATRALAEGGPFLGPVLAGAITLAGAVQLATINAQQFPGAAEGMLVAGGTPGKDSVLVNTMPGELIVPTKNFEEVISSVKASRLAEQRLNEGLQDNTSNEMNINLGLRGNLFDLIEAEIVERRALNISRI